MLKYIMEGCDILPVVCVTPLEESSWTNNNGNVLVNEPSISKKRMLSTPQSFEQCSPGNQDRLKVGKSHGTGNNAFGDGKQWHRVSTNKTSGDLATQNSCINSDGVRQESVSWKDSEYDNGMCLMNMACSGSAGLLLGKVTIAACTKQFLEKVDGKKTFDSSELECSKGETGSSPNLGDLKKLEICSKASNSLNRCLVKDAHVFANEESGLVCCTEATDFFLKSSSLQFRSLPQPAAKTKISNPVVVLSDIRKELDQNQLAQLQASVSRNEAAVQHSIVMQQKAAKAARNKKRIAVGKRILQNFNRGMKSSNLNTMSSTKRSVSLQRKDNVKVSKKRKRNLSSLSMETGGGDTQTSGGEMHFSSVASSERVRLEDDTMLNAVTRGNCAKLPQKSHEVSFSRKFRHISVKKLESHMEIVVTVESSRSVDSNLHKEYNFLFPRSLKELINAFQSCSEDVDCKAVLLSSVGPVFSSGLDPDSLLNWTPDQEYSENIIELMEDLCSILINFKKPLIAAVQGPAVGFGASILLHCDSVYASERACLQWPFVQMGLCPFGCSTELLTKSVGLCKARSLLIEGTQISARTAKEIGLFTDVFPHESLMRHATASCKRICQSPSIALLKLKRSLVSCHVKQFLKCNAREAARLKKVLSSSLCRSRLQHYLISHMMHE